MKSLSKYVLLLIVLLICCPVRGDIIVYNRSNKYWFASGSDIDWTITRSGARGYVLMDITYDPNGDIDSINDSIEIQYGKTGASEWYTETSHGFNVSRVVEGRFIKWLVVESIEVPGGGSMIMLNGKARHTGIGFDDPNEVAAHLKGRKLEYLPGGTNSAYVGTYALRLNKRLTRIYNTDSMTFNEALNAIRAFLEEKGYPVPD